MAVKRNWQSWGAAAFLLLLAGTFCSAAAAEPPNKKKEKQSAFATANNEVISSSGLIKKLNSKLDGKYQDLELIFSVCASGEFASRAKGANGLKGNWSVSTGTDTRHRCSDGTGKDKIRNGKEGLQIGDTYFHGYMAQHVKKLLQDKNSVGNKDLHDFAEANRHLGGDDPQYESSGKTADEMTVHGGTKSNHAIVLSGAGYTALSDELVIALKGAGYTDDTITYLTGTGVRPVSDGTKSDGAFSKATLDTALDNLRKELDKNPQEEKAYIFFSAHGSYRDRTIAFANLDTGLPGSGFLISNTDPSLNIFADSPELLVGLQEELPMAGGGFWADDPVLQREGQPYLAFSTAEEFFTDQTNVNVSLNGMSIGALTLGNPDGSDYLLNIPDEILDLIMPDIIASGDLDVSFLLPSASDYLRLATEADYLSLPHLMDYGVSIGGIIGSVEPIPEPNSALLSFLAVLAFTGAKFGKKWFKAAKPK